MFEILVVLYINYANNLLFCAHDCVRLCTTRSCCVAWLRSANHRPVLRAIVLKSRGCATCYVVTMCTRSARVEVVGRLGQRCDATSCEERGFGEYTRNIYILLVHKESYSCYSRAHLRAWSFFSFLSKRCWKRDCRWIIITNVFTDFVHLIDWSDTLDKL